MKEVFKNIKETKNTYQISNFGRVKRLERKVNSSVQPIGYRVIKESIKGLQDNGNGYLQVYIQINNKRKMFYVHRLVAQYFLPNPEFKKEVNHKDGNKYNNKYYNLEWSTKQENMNHASENNLISKGEEIYQSVLKEEEVLRIRRLYKINPNFNRSKVGRKLGVSYSAIHKIINNINWRHLL